MTESQIYDVAVIGYGPTGASAANLLGALGLRVVVLERDSDVYARARAISTDDEVMRIWQSAGLAERLQSEMLEGGNVAFVDAQGEPFIEVSAPSHGTGHPAQQFIYQPAVDMTLRAGVERFPHVRVLIEHECREVRSGADHAEVLAADLRTDSQVRFRARYVIAADGGSSSTRGALGIGYSGKTFTERWIVIDTEVRKDWPGSSRLRFHCDPDRPTVDCPTPLGHHRWEFPVRDGEDEHDLLSDEAIWKVLAGQGITDEHVKILRAVAYSHHVRVADRWRVGRIFLAGDAAHAMPPWIGQGMASGVRDAANLCWKLHAVITGSLPDSVLDSYQVEREPHVRTTTARAVAVGKLITERRRGVAALRRSLYGFLSRIGRVADLMIARRWVPEPVYPAGFRAQARHCAQGRQIPQPMVTDGAGRPVRLDDALPTGWAVLVGAATTPRGLQDWQLADVPVVRVARASAADAPGALVDTTGALTGWLARHRADAVVLRPDRFVYAAAAADGALPGPPDGFTQHTAGPAHESATPEAPAAGASDRPNTGVER